MNEQDLVKKSYEALQRARQRSAKEQLQRLIDKGVIDEQGDVQLWNFFLAIIAVSPSSDDEAFVRFRCLKPTLGMPGATTMDVSRDSLAQYVKEKKRVVTAYLDERQNRWKEGEEVHLTPQGHLRVDSQVIEEDNLGNLPEFAAEHDGRKASLNLTSHFGQA